MRTKQLIQGLNNNQKIRVILDGIGFYTTVKGTENMVFTSQRIAVQAVLYSIAAQGVQGMATTKRVYSERQTTEEYEVQVDLI
jgi:hypothetical protein